MCPDLEFEKCSHWNPGEIGQKKIYRDPVGSLCFLGSRWPGHVWGNWKSQNFGRGIKENWLSPSFFKILPRPPLIHLFRLWGGEKGRKWKGRQSGRVKASMLIWKAFGPQSQAKLGGSRLHNLPSLWPSASHSKPLEACFLCVKWGQYLSCRVSMKTKWNNACKHLAQCVAHCKESGGGDLYSNRKVRKDPSNTFYPFMKGDRIPHFPQELPFHTDYAHIPSSSGESSTV